MLYRLLTPPALDVVGMLPIRHKSIFKSRWIALLWAGGMLWGAIEFTG